MFRVCYALAIGCVYLKLAALPVKQATADICHSKQRCKVCRLRIGIMSTDDEASPSGRGHIVHAKEKATYFQDRGIHIAPNPTGASDLPWPTSPPEYRRPVSRPELRPPTQPTPPASQARHRQHCLFKSSSNNTALSWKMCMPAKQCSLSTASYLVFRARRVAAKGIPICRLLLWASTAHLAYWGQQHIR